MKFARLFLLPALILPLTSCNFLSRDTVSSQDCTVPTIPAGFTRIFIGLPTHGGQQSGTSAGDPLDGSTAEKFDTILRTIAEGQQPTWGTQKNIPAENLIVCIQSGTFQTNGQHDWVIAQGHTLGAALGFTVEKNWKIHGNGVNQTKLQLASYLPEQFIDNNGTSFNGGHNVVFGTHSDDASGVEISDLTIDANHDQMTAMNGPLLNLAAIALRSTAGHFWIHNLNVIGAANDAGFINIVYEDFAVKISGSNPAHPDVSTGNLIEKLNVSNPGKPVTSDSPPGGKMDGVVITGAIAEVRNNTVDSYFIGYGGWNMDHVNFHDNVTTNTFYGFNADALSNFNVTVASNQFIHPMRYGIVIGGPSVQQTFANWNVNKNTITLNTPGTLGLSLGGQVQNSSFTGNTIQADNGSAKNLLAILSFSESSSVSNSGNIFQDNHIDHALNIDFSHDPNFNTNCRYLNRDLQNNPLPSFPDNRSSQCN